MPKICPYCGFIPKRFMKDISDGNTSYNLNWYCTNCYKVVDADEIPKIKQDIREEIIKILEKKNVNK
mgnify:CR=1 FL=1